MDATDRRILREIQRDSSRSLADLAERIGASSSACHRRIGALTDAAVIQGYVALIDPLKVGLTLHVFVEIALISQSRDVMDRFEQAVMEFDDILDCHLMSGTADYLLRVAALDVADYDRLHRNCLSRLPGVSSMKSSFAIRKIKASNGYPLR
ncbi:MAG: Lrp/AsnC family transcriptional regulator [Novosphingobium sp.]